MQPEILANAPRCGARTRSGEPCRSPAVSGNRRCRMHGGKGSGAPRGNRNAWKHGIRSEWIRSVARYLRATRPAALPQLIERFVGPQEAGAPPRRSPAGFGAPMPRTAPGLDEREKTKKTNGQPHAPGITGEIGTCSGSRSHSPPPSCPSLLSSFQRKLESPDARARASLPRFQRPACGWGLSRAPALQAVEGLK